MTNNFDISNLPSIEYHNQLYGKLYKHYDENQSCVEDYLKKLYETNLTYILNPYNYSRYNKIETLPTYIRNASSHTENSDREYNEIDLKKSIEILREIIKK